MNPEGAHNVPSTLKKIFFFCKCLLISLNWASSDQCNVMLLVALTVQPRAQQPFASGCIAAEIPQVLMVLLAAECVLRASHSSLQLLMGQTPAWRKHQREKERTHKQWGCLHSSDLAWGGHSWWFQTAQK